MSANLNFIANLPPPESKRIVIVGGGFAGLKLARLLSNTTFQVVLLDKNNYHQFQPLFYQVATAGLEPSSISFPLRKIFQKSKNIHFRLAHVKSINLKESTLFTDIGALAYDYMVLANGVGTNFFNNQSIKENCIPMKSVSESIFLRNTILENFERAMNNGSHDEIETLLDFVIVGGGPTGTELSGALAEIKNNILPKEYPDMPYKSMSIMLIEAGSKLLNGFSEKASEKSKLYLEKMGVEIILNTSVLAYDGHTLQLSDGREHQTKNVIWAAGVKGIKLDGIPEEAYGPQNRILVNQYSKIIGTNNVFAIGDCSLMNATDHPRGHPQVAQVAIQQAKRLASNLKRPESQKPFKYKDLGALATIGRNKAVADLPIGSFQGFFAWVLWLAVHIFQIIGVKSKIFIFLNWAWSYITYDQSLRILIKPFQWKNSITIK